MTWEDFKREVEDLGVTDEDEIEQIEVFDVERPIRLHRDEDGAVTISG